MNIKIKTTLIILITFIIGMLAGSMITQAYIKYRMKKFLSMDMPAGFANHFERIIEPTDEQRKALREILYKYGKKMSEMRQKIREEFLPIDKAMREELDAILTPEQKKRLEERFFRRGPGGFFRPPGDKPPGPPWPGEKPPPPPPWLKKEPKQKEKTEDMGSVVQ
jgi:Spy/CpxP family protein refolding chaperone